MIKSIIKKTVVKNKLFFYSFFYIIIGNIAVIICTFISSAISNTISEAETICGGMSFKDIKVRKLHLRTENERLIIYERNLVNGIILTNDD
jgi:hypothetical protein